MQKKIEHIYLKSHGGPLDGQMRRMQPLDIERGWISCTNFMCNLTPADFDENGKLKLYRYRLDSTKTRLIYEAKL